MAVDVLTELDEAQARQGQQQQTADTQLMVRMTLAKSAPHPIDLRWNPGKGGQKFYKKWLQGESVMWPLDKAMAEFGPFGILTEYANTTDERRKNKLKEFWASEKQRVLDRYDYPRASLRDRAEVGPHRFPDITMTIIDADGAEHDTIRLHKIYKIGEFDPLKDRWASLDAEESIEDIKARYARELDEVHEQMRRRDEEHAKKLSEIAGMIKGANAANAKHAAKTAETVTA